MKKLHIQVYTSFITRTHLYVKGRILKDSPLLIKPTDGILSSLIYIVIRAFSREIKFLPVECKVGGTSYDVVTDNEGYFEIYENIKKENIKKENIENEKVRGDVLEISAKYKRRSNKIVTHIDDLTSNVPVGIISDIDDTIMVTGVKSFFKIKVILNTLFLNPFRRKPIEAAADAFHFLSNRVEGKGPVIYLSNSPWNLFIYLQTFLEYNGFPEGTLILRDMGWQLLKSRTIVQRNKYIEVEKILIAFSDTNFLLIGDTGELDFDIYQQLEEKYPERIEQIILNKAGNRKKEKMLHEYVKKNTKYKMLTGFTKVFDE
ncbi:MAG: phosphatidate phosphatase APP1 [Saprospiraceae bacterium]|jgi:phosphatidate phosphatase APP1